MASEITIFYIFLNAFQLTADYSTLQSVETSQPQKISLSSFPELSCVVEQNQMKHEQYIIHNFFFLIFILFSLRRRILFIGTVQTIQTKCSCLGVLILISFFVKNRINDISLISKQSNCMSHIKEKNVIRIKMVS